MANAAVKLHVNVEGLGQYTTSTCWFACYRMLYSWKHKDEKEIPGKIAGAGLDFQTLTKRGLLDHELPRAGTALGMEGRYAGSVSAYDIPTWVDRLRTFGPHWVGIQLAASKHAVLVYGADQGLNQIFYYDPYNRFEVGTVEKGYWTPDSLKKILVMTAFSVQVWGSGAKAEIVFQSPVGRWQVKIGNWAGLFVFKQNGSCSWSESGGQEHPGTWKTVAGEVQWTYSDDPDGWERVFHARLPLKAKVSGEATINGVNHGYYTMSKIG